MKENGGYKNNWKQNFFILAVVNGVILFGLLLLIFLPVSDSVVPEGTQTEEEGAEFTIKSTKQNLNELINGYIDQALANGSMNYAVSLEDDVELTGSISLFDSEIPLKINLEPVVQENGDLVLEQKNISLGRLNLPNKQVLEYLKKFYPMPEWITVNPEEESVYVAVTQMEMKSNFEVKIEQFDLENNQLAFAIKVPNKTLGLGTE